MSTLTVPDNIEYHDDSNTYDPSAAYAAIATSTQEAFLFRQGYTFRWDNSGDRDAERDMVPGSEGYQIDTQVTYKYNGTTWVAWHTIQAIAFTPTLTGITLGTGGQSTAYYTLSSGRYTVTGVVILGTGFAIGSATASLPLGLSALALSSEPIRGVAKYIDTGTTAYVGIVDQITNFDRVRLLVGDASGTYMKYVNITSLIPMTWAAADQITYEYSFIPA